jgi:hypothetical protein
VRGPAVHAAPISLGGTSCAARAADKKGTYGNKVRARESTMFWVLLFSLLASLLGGLIGFA